MPILERDQWRKDYFKDVYCPDHIVISTDDRDSFELYPEFRWVYDKTRICRTQNILCSPYPLKPESYPVFSKPITNLRGMGIESHLLQNEADYLSYCKEGHFWMEHLTGEHISTDIALLKGRIVWQAHVEGFSAGEGTFDYWHILKERKPALEDYCRNWLEEHLKNYTGMVNIESIGGKIIEVHLRMIDQWPDLYGEKWIDAVVSLYEYGVWTYDESPLREAFSVVLFGPEARLYSYPPLGLIEAIKKHPSVSSVQITFDKTKAPAQHAMPPGGFRLAIINGYDLASGRKGCATLADFFGVPYSSTRPDFSKQSQDA